MGSSVGRETPFRRQKGAKGLEGAAQGAPSPEDSTGNTRRDENLLLESIRKRKICWKHKKRYDENLLQ